ncbi:MAG TPA: HAMP domain-containing sensor histidine kinase [Flavobacteriales bacterium]|nr:HAMP domain-containing sensor histidine kinase [Flavobacteriales bacterium]
MPPEQGTPFDPLDAGQRNERLHTFAHAVKNRMGSMWQAASMLHDLPDGPERAQLLAMAEKSYFAGARELEQLMDDFAVPRGIGTLRKATFDLLPVLEGSIASIGFRTLKKAQQVNLRAPGPVMVHGDEHVLGQLFEALLSNASKFSPRNTSVEVDVATGPGRVDVLVVDRGVGLTADDLKEIFTRYAVLSSRSTDGESQARSTLARAKQWAMAHAGDIRAASNGPGAGCTFAVSLPLAPENT